MSNLVTLFRPVGIKELELIQQSGMKAFPPRLDWQPIFYPVLNKEYAVTIARDWNTKDAASGYCGFVTEFAIPEEYFQTFEVQQVGHSGHQELWVPADQLEEFNAMIVGEIRVIEEFRPD